MCPRRDPSCASGVVAEVILPCRFSADGCQDVDEVETKPACGADSDPSCVDWGDETYVVLNSVDRQNDRTRRGWELLASWTLVRLTMYSRRRQAKSISRKGARNHMAQLASKGANGAHIYHHGQRRFRVKPSAGGIMTTTWEVADARKSLISPPAVCSRGDTSWCWMQIPRVVMSSLLTVR